jgi:hypothetical protein
MLMLRIKASLFTLMLVTPFLYAQTPGNQPQAEEGDLRACLLLEQESLNQYRALEQKSNELRANEKLIKDQRTALKDQKAKIDITNPNKEAAAKFNKAVAAFNQQADKFNAEKDAFDKESGNYDNWVNTTLKPACNKVANKPVNPVSSYYACGFNGAKPLTDLQHCKTVPNLDTLRTCINKAESKTKAYETCPQN